MPPGKSPSPGGCQLSAGPAPEAVCAAFLAKDGSLGKLFAAARAPLVAAVWDRIRAWPPDQTVTGRRPLPSARI